MIDNGALKPDDVAFCWELYSRAVIRVYGPWADSRDTRWLPRPEVARAAYVVGVARQNLRTLGAE